MTDIKSKRIIVLKGLLFMLVAAASGAALIANSPSFTVAALVLILIWASARSYYFLFYVLEKYVDSSLKYAGLLGLLKSIRRVRTQQKLRKLWGAVAWDGDLDETRRD